MTRTMDTPKREPLPVRPRLPMRRDSQQVERGHLDGGNEAEEQAGEQRRGKGEGMSREWSEMSSMRGVPAGSRRTKRCAG